MRPASVEGRGVADGGVTVRGGDYRRSRADRCAVLRIVPWIVAWMVSTWSAVRVLVRRVVAIASMFG